MTGALVPAKPLELVAAMATSEDLLALWTTDLEKATPAQLHPLCVAAVSAIRNGSIAPLAAILLAPARRRELALELDELTAAFPTMRKDADISTFTRILAEEVIATRPSRAAVHGAVRALIRTSTFPPSIADVVRAVAEQKDLWASRAALLERLPRRAAEAVDALGRAGGGP